MHLLRINTIKSVIGRKILPIFAASLLSIVFCGSAWAISLRFKLEMLGYNEEEIAAIVSRKKSRPEIDRKIRMEMLCISVAKPLMPTDLQNREAKSSERIKHNLEAVKLTLPVSQKNSNPKGLNILGKAKPLMPPDLQNREAKNSKRVTHNLEIAKITLPVSHENSSPKDLDILGKAKPYFPLIKEIAAKTDVEKSLIMAVIKAESDFDPKAVSPKGAMGLMQLMPSTAKDLGVSDPFDPKENMHGGARYLSTYLKTFGDIELALAAYNAGPGQVEALRKIPPYPETKDFIKKVFYYKSLYDHILFKLK